MQRLAKIIVELRDVGGGNCTDVGIVIGRFGDIIQRWPTIAGIDSANGLVLAAQQLFGENRPTQAQIGLEPIIGRNTGKLVKLLGERLAIFFRQIGTLQQCLGISPQCKLLGLV
ncbi:hypothetical protein D3C72_1746080 [compost metagenome]